MGIVVAIALGCFFESIQWLLVMQITGAMLWLSTFGYVLTLVFMHRYGRRDPAGAPAGLPPVAVVIPVRNEAAMLPNKVRNLLETTYPLDLLRIVIADGGSTDGTLDIARECQALHPNLQVISVPDSQARSDQLNHVISALACEYVVFTDADSLLTPECITHLIHDLIDDLSLIHI